MAFTQKDISFQFDLAKGSFQGGGGGNSLTVSGLRAEVLIEKVGGYSIPNLSASIYGLTLSHMNQLTQIQQVTVTDYGTNKITVKAGDLGGQMTTVFIGSIYHAWMDASAMPDVTFRIEATSTGVEKYKPIAPTSKNGVADVAEVMKELAKKAGYDFEDNGVKVKLANIYLPGTIVTQIKTLARHAGIEHIIDLGKLAIWPVGKARQGTTTLISPETGMVGYPESLMIWGITVRTLFQPTLEYGLKVRVESSVTPASGEWIIFRLDYVLACQMPHGPWFCVVYLYKGGDLPVVP